MAYGGVGEVWRATDLVLGGPVAVKLLRAEYAQHPEVLARFRAEARHAGSVSHPGIAQVYDYGEDGAAGFAVPGDGTGGRAVPGPCAGVRAAGSRPAPWTCFAQAAAGLQAAHAAGLVHRDVKPGNLLVGPSGRVKITDFGIAHAAWSAPITQTGALVGTPAYLAPERVMGGPATPAATCTPSGWLATSKVSRLASQPGGRHGHPAIEVVEILLMRERYCCWKATPSVTRTAAASARFQQRSRVTPIRCSHPRRRF